MRRVSLARLVVVSIVSCLALLVPTMAAAQDCLPWPGPEQIPPEWQNPHSAEGDLILSLDSGISFVFREVPINSTSLYGDATFKMGSAKERLFETKLDVRISSPITGSDGRRVLYLGKYEITKAQFIYVMGNGDPIVGLEYLLDVTGDKRVISSLSSILDGTSSCAEELDSQAKRILSEPITYLSYVDYVDFVNRLNEHCIATDSCAEQLRSFTNNREVAAFFRLPSEHEWEYAARRGASYANEEINEAQFQLDLPDLPNQGNLEDYSHLNGTPNRLIPIGSKEPIDGLYDTLGNAQEIMQNAFTSETGYGAVGGYVARGGHYKMKASSLRVSSRAELLPFRVDDESGKIERQKFPYSGLRLALSMPVVGSANRLGSQQLFDEFTNEYASFDSANDRGGNTFAEAEHLGTLRGSDIKVSDELDAVDTQDFFSIDLAAYGRLSISSNGTDNPWTVSVFEQSEVLVKSERFDVKSSVETEELLPGRYVIKIEHSGAGSNHGNYDISINRTLAKDTGFATASSALFDEKANVLVPYVSQKAKKIRTGYVGKGDFADVYPIENNGSTDAIKFTVLDALNPIILRILSEDQRVIAEGLVSAGEDLLAPMDRNSRGFVQVVAPENSLGTTYTITARTTILVPTQFYRSATLAKAGIIIGEDRSYKGLIGGSHLEWHFRFSVTNYSNVTLAVTGLKESVEVRVRDSSNKTVTRTQGGSSEGSELFQEDLEPGRYFVRLSLKDRSKVTPFAVRLTTNKPSRTKVLTVAEAKRDAEKLPHRLGDKIRYMKTSEVAGVKYLSFTTKPGSGNYTFRVDQFSARSDINMYLEEYSGALIAKSENVGSQPEMFEVSLPASKRYFLRVEAVGVDPVSSFTLRLLVSEGLGSQLLDFGTVVSEHKDWEVRERLSDGRCYAVAEAESYTPKLGDWPASEIPIFYVGYERASKNIWTALFYKGGQKSEYAKVSVSSGGGWRRVTEVKYDKEYLKPLSAEKTISSDAIRAFTRGNKLRVETKLEGTVYEFVYSLAGYSAANRAANRHCGAKASWTVK